MIYLDECVIITYFGTHTDSSNVLYLYSCTSDNVNCDISE